MDTYTKTALAIIAAGIWCLVFLEFRQSEQPTIGDLRATAEISDESLRAQQRKKLADQIPIVRVQNN